MSLKWQLEKLQFFATSEFVLWRLTFINNKQTNKPLNQIILGLDVAPVHPPMITWAPPFEINYTPYTPPKTQVF